MFSKLGPIKKTIKTAFRKANPNKVDILLMLERFLSSFWSIGVRLIIDFQIRQDIENIKGINVTETNPTRSLIFFVSPATFVRVKRISIPVMIVASICKISLSSIVVKPLAY
jgi:hypothetical protein